jgi:hypothetical protein
MKKVYVAGAYSDDNVTAVLRNIGRGEEYASRLFKHGLAPFTPWHDKTFVITHWRDDIPVKAFYDYSMEWLRVSDAVFIVPNCEGLRNWEDSKGTVAEIAEAKKQGIPVFYEMFDLLKHFKII